MLMLMVCRWAKLVPKGRCWTRPRTSTDRCRRWATWSRRWPTATSRTSRIVIRSWPASSKNRWAVTRAPRSSPAARPPPSTRPKPRRRSTSDGGDPPVPCHFCQVPPLRLTCSIDEIEQIFSTLTFSGMLSAFTCLNCTDGFIHFCQIKKSLTYDCLIEMLTVDDKFINWSLVLTTQIVLIDHRVIQILFSPNWFKLSVSLLNLTRL